MAQQTVEFDLAKILEDIRQEIKNTNNKIDKLTEITNEKEENYWLKKYLY